LEEIKDGNLELSRRNRKATLAANKTLKSIWRASPSLGNTMDLFTHILYDNTNGYGYEFPNPIVKK